MVSRMPNPMVEGGGGMRDRWGDLGIAGVCGVRLAPSMFSAEALTSARPGFAWCSARKQLGDPGDRLEVCGKGGGDRGSTWRAEDTA